MTKSSFTHTAIYVDGVLYEALGNGVNRRTGDAARNRALGAVAYVTVNVDHTLQKRGVLVTSDYAEMVNFLETETRDAYSVTQLITDGIAILTGHRWIIAANGCWTCSGLVAAALTAARVPIQPDKGWDDPATFSPADLAAVLHPTTASVPAGALS